MQRTTVDLCVLQPVIRLPKTLSAWLTPSFEKAFEQEVMSLERSMLPLMQGMSRGSQISSAEIDVMLLDAAETPSSIQLRVGIFFSSVIAGCSCADDPTPLDENAEYCELQLDIDKSSAAARVILLDD